MKNATRDLKQIGRRQQAQIRYLLQLIRSLQSPIESVRTRTIHNFDSDSLAEALALPVCVRNGHDRKRKRIIHHFVAAVVSMDLLAHSSKDLKTLGRVLRLVFWKLPEGRGFMRRKLLVMRTFKLVDAARSRQKNAERELKKQQDGTKENLEARDKQWQSLQDSNPDECLRVVADFAAEPSEHPKVRANAILFILRGSEELLSSSENRAYFYVGLTEIPLEERDACELSVIASAMVQILISTPQEERIPDWAAEMLPVSDSLAQMTEAKTCKQALDYLRTLLE